MGKVDVTTEIKEVGENTVLVIRLPQRMKVSHPSVMKLAWLIRSPSTFSQMVREWPHSASKALPWRSAPFMGK